MTYDLAQLRVFLAVAETGTGGLAADRLHMSQPALSRAIKRLENAVGEQLFERHATGMRLTAYGEALLPHAQLLNREEAAAREQMNAMRGLAAGTLKIGSSSSTSALMLPNILALFWKRWPGIQVEAVEGVRDELMLALAGYEVDLILATESAETPDVIAISDCRWNENVGVVVGRSHPLRGRSDRISMSELAGERWCLTPAGTDPRQRLMQLFVASGYPLPDTVLSTTSIQMLKSSVVHSNLISWLTDPMYEAEKLAGNMHPIDVIGLTETRTFTVFRRRNGVLSRPASSLIGILREYLANAKLNALPTWTE